MSSTMRIGLIIGAAALGASLFYFLRKPTMIYAHDLTNIQSSADAIAIFPTSIEQIKAGTKQAIEETKKELEAIIAIPESERTYANTVAAFDNLIGFSNLAILGALSQTVDLINPDEKMRAAGREALVEISNYLIEVTSDKRVYAAFKAYTQGNAKNETLTAEQKYFLDETMKDFERSGLNLPDEELDEVKRIKKELAQFEIDFSKNIADDQRKIMVNKEGLEGLSEGFIKSLTADAEGNYTLGTDTPTYVQVMENCKNATTRKNLWNVYQNRAYPINKEVLEKIIAKRYELAKLLGYDSYATLELDGQMVGNPARAQQFLDGIAVKAKAKAAAEFKEFTKNLPESIMLTSDGKLYPWDTAFLKNYYKKTALNLDENKVAEYFPMQHTVDSLLKIYQEFFNLEFKQLPAKGLWDPEVKLIEVIDKATQKTLGYLFLDLFPRPGKYTHACEQTIVPSIYLPDGKANLAVILVVANFPRATAEKPSLLKYRDVTTFFHEFGHAIHALFGRTAIVSQSGVAVKRDFVEMPSQMLEEWMRDPGILKMVSHHYQTGQPMPDDLIAAILKLRTYDSGFSVCRQLYLANFSLHCFDNGPQVNIEELRKKLFNTFMYGIQYNSDDHQYAAFGHLTGYGARYYGYLWSEVFAHDLFDEISKEGLLNPAIGRRYRDQVIGKGASKDPNDLLKDFLGREPNQKAFMRNMGF